ncbi:hypothetical protein BDZ94DRAFT_1227071, partial [Collybia nuda]
TQTIGSRTVFHEAQAALRPLLNNIQTQEQLDTLINRLDTIRFAHILRIKDPPIIAHKGRPCTARITGQLEGQPQGGGAGICAQASQGNKRRKVSCGVCHEEGHNRSTCPFRV